METDARGQLGGLDTTEDVRRRLARESRSFKCVTCARSNADIISESEKQANESCSLSKNLVQVPTELSMGWRDEMGSRNQRHEGDLASHHDRPKVAQDSDSDIAELAEGFVPTAPTNQNLIEKPHPISLPRGEGSSSSQEQPTQSHISAERGSSGRPSIQAVEAGQRQLAPIAQRVDEVPLWIDRAIVALVIVLAALLLKVLFGI